MNRKPPVVVVENELLAGRGAVEPELAPRDDLGTRPGAQPLCLRPPVEGRERDVDVLELLGDAADCEILETRPTNDRSPVFPVVAVPASFGSVNATQSDEEEP